MTGRFNNVGVMGIAAAVPKQQSDNELYVSIVGERRVRKQAKLTGIEKSHVSPIRQRTSDLCFYSARKLMEHLGWKPEDISVMVLASQTTNYRLPSTAFWIQKKLGLSEDCLVYDINMGCSACNIGIQNVAAHLSNMIIGSKGLVLCGDICNEPISDQGLVPEVVRNSMLFGSAGAAVAIEAIPNKSIHYMIKSRGQSFDTIIGFQQTPTHMDGDLVFEFAINDVAKDILAFEKNTIPRNDTDYIVLHQAQKMIVDSVVDSCEYPDEMVLNSYSEYGNTSGASIPLSICANREKINKETPRFLICGFGVGLSWAINYFDVPIDNILPVIETDEYDYSDIQPVSYLWNKSILFYGLEDPRCTAAIEGIMEKTCKNTYTVTNDIELLKSIEKRCILPITNSVIGDMNAIVENIKSNQDNLAGMIISCNYLSDEETIELIRYIDEQHAFDPKSVSIILLDESDDEQDMRDRLEYLNKTYKEDRFSFNFIDVKTEKICFVPRIERYSKWLNEYNRSDKKEEMSRAYDISNVILCLISDITRYIKNSIIHLD